MFGRLGLFSLLSALIHILFLFFVLLRMDVSAPLAGRGGEISIYVEGLEQPFGKGEGSTAQPGASSRTGLKGEGWGEGPRGIGAGTSGQNPRLSAILSRIEAVKRFPLLASRVGIEGRTQVQFRISQDGNPEQVELLHSSGSEILDRETILTIQRGAPYPPYEDPVKVWLDYDTKPTS